MQGQSFVDQAQIKDGIWTRITYLWAVGSRAVPLVVRLIKVEENQVRSVGIRHRQPLHCFVYTLLICDAPKNDFFK